jgi:hypothetical protein
MNKLNQEETAKLEIWMNWLNSGHSLVIAYDADGREKISLNDLGQLAVVPPDGEYSTPFFIEPDCVNQYLIDRIESEPEFKKNPYRI